MVPNTQLKHILSLWQVLAARRSMLLVQMNQVRDVRSGEENVGFAPLGEERKPTVVQPGATSDVPVSSLGKVKFSGLS